MRHWLGRSVDMATKTYNIRMEEGLKASMNEVAVEIGLTTAAAFNAFAKRFVSERGFPSDVRAPGT